MCIDIHKTEDAGLQPGRLFVSTLEILPSDVETSLTVISHRSLLLSYFLFFSVPSGSRWRNKFQDTGRLILTRSWQNNTLTTQQQRLPHSNFLLNKKYNVLYNINGGTKTPLLSIFQAFLLAVLVEEGLEKEGIVGIF